MRTLFTRSLIVLFFLCSTCTFGQVTLRLRPDSVLGKDAYVADWTPNQNFGPHPEYASMAWTCNGDPCVGRGLIEFDLTGIPNGSTVNSATLSLYANPSPVNGNGLATQGANASWIERIVDPWDESTVTWATAPATTLSNRVMLPQSTSNFQNYVVNVTDLVIDMVNQPAQSHGFMLRLDDETYYTSMIFASSDFADSAYWPMLEVVYTPPTAPQCRTVFVDEGDGQDAIVTTFGANTPYPNHEEFGAIAWTCNGDPCWQHGLMQFDLSFIPSNAVVDSAFLDLYSNPSAQVVPPMQGSNASYLKRIVSSWDDATVTWNTHPLTTTQNQVLLTGSPSGYSNYLHWDVLSLVRDMVASPSSSFGFEIELDDPVYYRSMVFASSDYPDTSLHPSLKVCYRVSTGVAEQTGSIRGLSIYPNPAKDQLSISFYMKEMSDVRLELTDMQGRIVRRQQLNSLHVGEQVVRLTLSDDQLSSGIYFVQLFANDGFLSRKVQIVR